MSESQKFIALFYGRTGLGKSECALHYANWRTVEPLLDNSAPTQVIPKSVVQCGAAIYTPEVGATQKMVQSAIALLRNRFDDIVDRASSWHSFESGPFAPHKYLKLLIIDESDRLKPASLEYIRDLYDRTNLSILLIGSPGIDRRLKRASLGQLHSRFSLAYDIQPLNTEEMRLFINLKWEELNLPLSADDAVSSAIMRIANGNFRALHRIFSEIKRLQKLMAPSSIAGTGDLHTPTGKHNLETPKKMSLEEIKEVTQQFGSAAKLAKEANFDGIEIHGAFGYLIDQFLQDVSNHRTDNYGGSTENRSRFALEILQTVCSVWDSKRVGIKLSPSNTFYGMGDSNPELIFGYLLSELNNLGLAYVHMMRPTPEDLKAGQTIVDTLSFARRFYNGTLIANGGFEKIEAETVIETGLAELVSFGRLFLANPDLPERFRCNASLNDADGRTFYGAGPDSIKGYTDYPSLAETLARG